VVTAYSLAKYLGSEQLIMDMVKLMVQSSWTHQYVCPEYGQYKPGKHCEKSCEEHHAAKSK